MLVQHLSFKRLATLKEAVDITRDFAVANRLETEAGVNLTSSVSKKLKLTRYSQYMMQVGAKSKNRRSAGILKRQESANMATNVALSMLERQALHQQ